MLFIREKANEIQRRQPMGVIRIMRTQYFAKPIMTLWESSCPCPSYPRAAINGITAGRSTSISNVEVSFPRSSFTCT